MCKQLSFVCICLLFACVYIYIDCSFVYVYTVYECVRVCVYIDVLVFAGMTHVEVRRQFTGVSALNHVGSRH